MAEVKLVKLELEQPVSTKSETGKKKTVTSSKTKQKRSTSTEKTKAVKPRKTSQSRSKSRSSSRPRTGAKNNTLGAKVYTKKELAKKEVPVETQLPAKRTTRRSVSAQSNQDVSKQSIDASKELGHINEEINVSLTEIIADAQKSRYDLRKRATTPLDRASSVGKATTSTPVGSVPSSPSRLHLSCQSIKNRFNGLRCCSFLNKCFESGYLRFTINQLFQILIASFLLVVTLGIINYYNLFDPKSLGHLFDRLTKYFKFPCSYVANISNKSWVYIQNLPNTISNLFRK